MSVGGNDNIALLSHQTDVPAEGEELTNGTLRATLAIE